MQIKFFAYIRDYTGCKETELSGCPDLRSLIAALCARYPALRGKMLNADGSDLHEEIIIMVNGRRVELLAGLDTGLSPTDRISIFPLVAGG